MVCIITLTDTQQGDSEQPPLTTKSNRRQATEGPVRHKRQLIANAGVISFTKHSFTYSRNMYIVR